MSNSILVKYGLLSILVKYGLLSILMIILSGCSNISDHSMMMTISGSDFDCRTINESLGTISNKYTNKQIDGNECHMQTHMLTRSIVASCGVNTAQQHISYQCRNAMIHGIMEGYALRQSGSSNLVTDQLEFCNQTYSLSSIHWGECIHGIGNGLIIINQLDIHKAIVGCDLLLTDELKNICITGIYGGLFRYEQVTDRNGSFCSGKPYESICRNYVGYYFDPQQYTEQSWCKESNDINNCGYGLGVMYSRTTDNDVEKIAKVCQTKSCLQGAIWEAKRIDNLEAANYLELQL